MLLLYRGEGFSANFYHQAGVDIDHCFFVGGLSKKTLLVPAMNAALARSQFRGRIIVYRDALKELKKLLKGRKVEFDGASMSSRMARKIRRFCRIEDVSEELLLSRAKKKPAEAAHIRRAVKETKSIIESIDWKAARTEQDVHKQLLMMTLERGLEPAFEPIVSSGQGTGYPHYRAGARKLGPLVLVDYGVKYKHYCADITRCFIRDSDRKKKEQYQRLQDICYFLADSLQSLRSGKEVAELALDLMQKAGFPKMPHSIGHGIGLDVHEFPRLSAKSDDGLKGATLAIEPSFYLKNYGMRFEETMHFDGRRVRIF